MIQRRDFITLLGGAAVAWPMAALGQLPERIRRIGVLMNLTADDPESSARITGFAQGLAELGWTVGRNVQIEYRFNAGRIGLVRQHTEELIGLAPDLILVQGGFAMGPLLQATRTIPIVFVNVNDPVGNGLVANLARPGGNATGFMSIEFSTAGKLLELLKQIAPSVTRAAVLRDPTLGGGTSMFAAIQTVAPSLRVEVTPVNVRDAGVIERDVTAFASSANDGLVVTTSTLAQIHRDVIIGLAAQHRLPAVYPYRFFVTRGGLISYGPNQTIQYRQAAGYVDRILRGEKPADIPVQAPTKFETVLNIKTANALGLPIPPGVLAIADEVIE